MHESFWVFNRIVISGENNPYESGNQTIFSFIGWSYSEAPNACQSVNNLFLQQ